MKKDLANLNSQLGRCMTSAILSASIDKRMHLCRLLEPTTVQLEDVIQNPIMIPGNLLAMISEELEMQNLICEILVANIKRQ